MVITILIAFVSLIGLIVLHELGHFILAKRFGVRVEEFGIFLPPRLIGKKIGETTYSLNLLPLGAFVKLYGEEDHEKVTEAPPHLPPRPALQGSAKEDWSFTQKPIWQRSLIVFGGVLSFWITAAILLSIVMGLGAPVAVEDEANHNLKNLKVQIAAVAPGSPADLFGLKPGDTIKEFSIFNYPSKARVGDEGEAFSDLQFSVNKVKEIQELTEKYKGNEITLTIERGKEVFDVSLVPRVSPPKDEGPMGVALVRTAIKSYPWYQAPFQGILATGNLTVGVIQGWIQAAQNYFQGRPSGAQLMGPVGIFSLFTQISQLGAVYFLRFIAIISLYLALFNILPIPVVDGGKLLFLVIEAVRKKPIPPKIEQNINSFFFALLLTLMVWVTIKDIARLL